MHRKGYADKGVFGTRSSLTHFGSNGSRILGNNVYGIFLVKCVLHVFGYESKVLILCFKVLRVILRKSANEGPWMAKVPMKVLGWQKCQ